MLTTGGREGEKEGQAQAERGLGPRASRAEGDGSCLCLREHFLGVCFVLSLEPTAATPPISQPA